MATSKLSTQVTIPVHWEPARPALNRYLSDLARAVNTVEWNVVKKASSTVQNNTAAYVSDADLVFPAAASTKYTFRGVLFFDTSATADFKFQLAGPASPTLLRFQHTVVIPGGSALSSIAVDSAYSTSVAVTGAGTSGGYVQFDGILHNGTTAGEVALQWAQNTADASNTTVLAGSYLEWMRI